MQAKWKANLWGGPLVSRISKDRRRKTQTTKGMLRKRTKQKKSLNYRLLDQEDGNRSVLVSDY